MTLQERILEVIGASALSPRELYARLAGENAGIVDCAIAGLLKAGRLEKSFGAYQRPNAGSGSKPAQPAPQPAAPPAHAPIATKAEEEHERRCRRCKARKALGEFAGPNARVCIPCTRPTGRPPKKPITVSPRIIAALEKRRMDLAEEIERAAADIEKGREELADLIQFLSWVKTQTGAC